MNLSMICNFKYYCQRIKILTLIKKKYCTNGFSIFLITARTIYEESCSSLNIHKKILPMLLRKKKKYNNNYDVCCFC